MKKLNLGVIGLSEGNGHPYSWSAIFNGYDQDEMKDCGFPVIPEYLSKQTYPDDFLTDLAIVTHVWSQDINLSNSIARSARIDNITRTPEEMIGKVDAVLLARDDAENHLKLSRPFLEAGVPVFIDKPFALSTKDALYMLRSQRFESQIFTCSSLRYAMELRLSDREKMEVGEINYVDGSVMKIWKTYGIHILEPLVAQLPHRGKLLNVQALLHDQIHIVLIKWENCLANLKMTGKIPAELALNFYGSKKHIQKAFSDSFACFRASLKEFIMQIHTQKVCIDRQQTLEIVKIIEKGIC